MPLPMYRQQPKLFVGIIHTRSNESTIAAHGGGEAEESKLRLASATAVPDHGLTTTPRTSSTTTTPSLPSAPSPSRPVKTTSSTGRLDEECWRTKDCHSSIFRSRFCLPPHSFEDERSSVAHHDYLGSQLSTDGAFLSSESDERQLVEQDDDDEGYSMWTIRRCDAFDEDDDDYDFEY